MAEPRSTAARRADVLAKLGAPVADAWVATAADDDAHLVPLTLAWHDERIVLATARSSATGRNLVRTRRARLALGGTRDVVMIQAELETTLAVDGSEAAAVGAAYATQNDWDPRTAGPGYAFFVLHPVTIRAWREVDEIPNRLVMRDGRWLG